MFDLDAMLSTPTNAAFEAGKDMDHDEQEDSVEVPDVETPAEMPVNTSPVLRI